VSTSVSNLTNNICYLRSTWRTLHAKCPGVPLIWDPADPGSVFSNYPWTRHGFKGQSLGYKLGTAYYDGDKFKYFSIHSSACIGAADTFGSTCVPCSRLTENKGKIDALRKLANDPPGRLNFKYQTHDQLVNGSTAKTKLSMEDQRMIFGPINIYSQTLNLIRDLSIAIRRIEVDIRFTDVILSNSSTRVDQLSSQSLQLQGI
jgi:hypothetical protein